MATRPACPVGPAPLTVTLASSMPPPVLEATSRTQPSPTEQACSVTHVGATAPAEAPADGESHGFAFQHEVIAVLYLHFEMGREVASMTTTARAAPITP